MRPQDKWSVTIWRIGASGGYTACGTSIRDAFETALSAAGIAYVRGGEFANGRGFWRDMLPDFKEGLASCRALIVAKRNVPRVSWDNAARDCAVEIKRL